MITKVTRYHWCDKQIINTMRAAEDIFLWFRGNKLVIKCPVFLLLSSKPASSATSSPSPELVPPESIPLARVSTSSRSYDLQDRRCTGNMTGAEQAKYQRIPTDESEAQTLASADLDGIKSEYRSIQT